MPNDFEIRAALVRLYAQQGDYAQAVAELDSLAADASLLPAQAEAARRAAAELRGQAGLPAVEVLPAEPMPAGPPPVVCPRCGSREYSAHKKGFGVGKAALGFVALGPLGLVGGAVGAGKVKLTCHACGHTWKPGR
ncbi:MAG: tetratricopeptide repeat protein [Thermodesulfobacteriota bacterium]